MKVVLLEKMRKSVHKTFLYVLKVKNAKKKY